MSTRSCRGVANRRTQVNSRRRTRESRLMLPEKVDGFHFFNEGEDRLAIAIERL